jgi:hypothetical protein
MNDPISESSFRVSLNTDAGLKGSLLLVAKDAPSIITPGTSVMGSGDSIKASPALRRVFEIEFGFATCLNLSRVSTSATHPATIFRALNVRVTELAPDLRS